MMDKKILSDDEIADYLQHRIVIGIMIKRKNHCVLRIVLMIFPRVLP